MVESEVMAGRKFKIYVGGISSQASKFKIKTYFQLFGDVLKVQTFGKTSKKDSKTGAAKKIKGFCIVIVRDEETFNNILSFKEHCLEGRKIICSQFVTGSELEINNREKNQRRVIVKGIPSDLPEHSLKAFLESIAGEIEVLFPFKSDKPKKVKVVEIKKLRTYSVMFTSIASAEALINSSDLRLPTGEPLTPLRFVLRRNKAPSKSSEDENPVETTSKNFESPAAATGSFQSHLKWANYEKSAYLGSKPSLESLTRITSLGGLKSGNTKSQHNWESHFVKPTSRTYAKRETFNGGSQARYRFNLVYANPCMAQQPFIQC